MRDSILRILNANEPLIFIVVIEDGFAERVGRADKMIVAVVLKDDECVMRRAYLQYISLTIAIDFEYASFAFSILRSAP